MQGIVSLCCAMTQLYVYSVNFRIVLLDVHIFLCTSIFYVSGGFCTSLPNQVGSSGAGWRGRLKYSHLAIPPLARLGTLVETMVMLGRANFYKVTVTEFCKSECASPLSSFSFTRTILLGLQLYGGLRFSLLDWSCGGSSSCSSRLLLLPITGIKQSKQLKVNMSRNSCPRSSINTA